MTYPYDISMLTCYKGRDSCIKRDLGGEVNYLTIFLSNNTYLYLSIRPSMYALFCIIMHLTFFIIVQFGLTFLKNKDDNIHKSEALKR